MKRAGRYLGIQLKRMLHSFPAVFLVTLILVGALILVVQGILAEQSSGEKQSMIEVGVAGDIEDSYLGFGILALQHLDSSRMAINFHMMEEKEAREALIAGELTAYLVVPEGFVDSVVAGENFSIKYYTCNGQMGLGTLLMNEVAQIVSELITKSQSAIYGMQDICRDYGYNDIYWDATNELNLQYIDLILSRTDFFNIETLGISNELSTQGYYICGFAVLFFMIFGMNGCPIFVRRDLSLAKLMTVNGVSAIWQVVIEFVAYLALVLISILSVFAILGGVCEWIEFSVPEWRNTDFTTVLSFGISLIPIVIMLTAMAMLGHELTDNIVSGMLLQFVIALSMGYVSGCFYPNSFFPEKIQMIGRILPSGVATQYASQCMRSEVGVGMVFAIIGYTILFLGATWLVRRKKLV